MRACTGFAPMPWPLRCTDTARGAHPATAGGVAQRSKHTPPNHPIPFILDQLPMPCEMAWADREQ
ncbi:MAG: hypothetical protein IPL78_19430 [Chloroflexi bacterium]|nr:hypothetical protein [Chloroflexota bacterium]